MTGPARALTLLCERELLVTARQPALAVALCAHAGVTTAFVLAWGQTAAASAFPGRTFYDGVRLFQLALLVLLLPWMAARAAAPDRGDDTVWLAAAAGVTPSLLMTARAITLLLALGVVVAAGLPAMVMAARMTPASASSFTRDELLVQALGALAVATVLAWRHVCRDRLTAWLAATLSTLALTAATRVELPSATLSAALLAMVGALLLAFVLWSHHGFTYLEERAS